MWIKGLFGAFFRMDAVDVRTGTTNMARPNQRL